MRNGKGVKGCHQKAFFNHYPISRLLLDDPVALPVVYFRWLINHLNSLVSGGVWRVD